MLDVLAVDLLDVSELLSLLRSAAGVTATLLVDLDPRCLGLLLAITDLQLDLLFKIKDQRVVQEEIATKEFLDKKLLCKVCVIYDIIEIFHVSFCGH